MKSKFLKNVLMKNNFLTFVEMEIKANETQTFSSFIFEKVFDGHFS